MKFVKTADKNLVAKVIAERLVRELSLEKKVLWLMPGGSNIEIAVEIMQKIPAELSRNLTIGLTDERFGKIGHQDSNYEQYKIAGFDAKFAKFVPVLDGSRSFGDNVKNYEPIFREMLAQNDLKIGFFGMGPDGHAAGILPGSPAALETSRNNSGRNFREKLIAGYHSHQMVGDHLDKFDRITLTFAAIRELDVAFVAAFGSAKKSALQNLAKNISLKIQPAQIFKQVRESVIFNDLI